MASIAVYMLVMELNEVIQPMIQQSLQKFNLIHLTKSKDQSQLHSRHQKNQLSQIPTRRISQKERKMRADLCESV